VTLGVLPSNHKGGGGVGERVQGGRAGGDGGVGYRGRSKTNAPLGKQYGRRIKSSEVRAARETTGRKLDYQVENGVISRKKKTQTRNEERE